MIIELTETFANLPNLWVIYLIRHRDEHGQFQPWYIGKCRLFELTFFPDARRNSEWMKHFNAYREAEVTVLHFLPDEVTAYNKMAEVIRLTKPHCNIRGHDLQPATSSYGRPIIVCNETNEEFRTITEIVMRYGGSPGNYSRHLKQMAGHRTVKGRSFRYK